ncbi:MULTISPECIES: CDP-alcohol phosphatidyltransferase family protein [unclassified Halorhodospira]|uniref:CDP-alcohol phosphatidyltransferase family protein n=1 Tax=unclassified Halorhodospira TaxID=2626748 RepID=UPI001EE81C2A|nr:MULTISPECIES: CDP-alcohol phosphatidyltransferase family protein [unclassified Halorhodospira]MCG5541848.1 CDP-alcohol phosphatidyltransferase family protein [Halorhodospira sp. M39old]MCG5546918.1 CDP-alcohol phosphatidyltransferase family protein [Halorhodospira sp. M38]
MMKSPWKINKNHTKGNDANLWAKFVLRPGGNILSYPFIAFGVAPNFVTWLSLFTGLIGALCIALSQAMLGILLLFLSQLLDYADGTVARALDKRSGWGRFLDSQFGKYINAAKWVAVVWLFIAYEHNTVIPVEFLILCAVSVPIIGSLSQSVKQQKTNYENRVRKQAGSLSTTGLVSGMSELVKHATKKIEKLILYLLGLWQGVSFPFFALSLIGGFLEFYVLASIFFAIYALAYAWLKAFMTNAFLKENPL